MNNQIEIAVTLFKSIVTRSKRFDRDIRKNPLALKATIAAYAAAKSKADKLDKGKNDAMRQSMTKSGLGIFWTKKADKYVQTDSLKMELSAIKICSDNNLHELSDADFADMIAACDFEIASVRCFKDNFFATPATPKKAASGKKQPSDFDATHPDDIELSLPETKTDTRTKEEIFQNFLTVWNKAGHGNFWDWIETQSDDQIAKMTKAATKKAA